MPAPNKKPTQHSQEIVLQLKIGVGQVLMRQSRLLKDLFLQTICLQKMTFFLP